MARAARCPATSRTNWRRSNEDIAALRKYARDLDADVIALQEVDGADAARLVFPDYDFCFSGRVAVQNNGFAIRRGLPIRLRPGARWISRSTTTCAAASSSSSFPGRRTNLRLLSVHLKSGCARDRARLDAARLRGACAPGAGPRALDRRPGERT